MIYILLIGLMYIFLFPLITILVAAFQAPEAVMDPTVKWVPKALSLDAMKEAMTSVSYSGITGKDITSTVALAVNEKNIRHLCCLLAHGVWAGAV